MYLENCIGGGGNMWCFRSRCVQI